MKVKELIELLQRVDGDTKIACDIEPIDEEEIGNETSTNI